MKGTTEYGLTRAECVDCGMETIVLVYPQTKVCRCLACELKDERLGGVRLFLTLPTMEVVQ